MRKTWLVRAGVIGIVALACLAAASLGLSVYRIRTGSMTPVYPVGTIVVDSRALAPTVGRPLTFLAQGEPVTHVLVGYGPDGRLLTRGIANPANDVWLPPVYPRDIQGGVAVALLLFAPGFWLSVRGLACAAGLFLLAAAWFMAARPSHARFSSSSK